MNKRLAALGCALLLSVGVARAAPAYNTWECTATQVWPRASTGASADTLTRALGADSIAVTDSVSVYGARAVFLLAKSSGSDSLAIPVLQMRLPNGSLHGTGGVSFTPYSGFTSTSGQSATATISGVVRAIWGVYNETTLGGATPIPIVNDWFRWRVKSSDLRRYSGALDTNLSSTGNITIWALVWR